MYYKPHIREEHITDTYTIESGETEEHKNRASNDGSNEEYIWGNYLEVNEKEDEPTENIDSVRTTKSFRMIYKSPLYGPECGFTHSEANYYTALVAACYHDIETE